MSQSLQGPTSMGDKIYYESIDSSESLPTQQEHSSTDSWESSLNKQEQENNSCFSSFFTTFWEYACECLSILFGCLFSYDEDISSPDKKVDTAQDKERMELHILSSLSVTKSTVERLLSGLLKTWTFDPVLEFNELKKALALLTKDCQKLEDSSQKKEYVTFAKEWTDLLPLIENKVSLGIKMDSFRYGNEHTMTSLKAELEKFLKSVPNDSKIREECLLFVGKSLEEILRCAIAKGYQLNSEQKRLTEISQNIQNEEIEKNLLDNAFPPNTSPPNTSPAAPQELDVTKSSQEEITSEQKATGTVTSIPAASFSSSQTPSKIYENKILELSKKQSKLTYNMNNFKSGIYSGTLDDLKKELQSYQNDVESFYENDAYNYIFTIFSKEPDLRIAKAFIKNSLDYLEAVLIKNSLKYLEAYSG